MLIFTIPTKWEPAMQRYKLYNTVQNNLGKFSSFFSFLAERTFENFVAIAISTKENIRNNGIFQLSPDE